jgi:hypothetical protein
VLTVHAFPQGDTWVCEVDIDDESKTHHVVKVTHEDIDRWGQGAPGRETVEDLVRRSFEFLLEREPATSILRTFDLSVIRRYFPEYDSRFKR